MLAAAKNKEPEFSPGAVCARLMRRLHLAGWDAGPGDATITLEAARLSVSQGQALASCARDAPAATRRRWIAPWGPKSAIEVLPINAS